MFAGPKGPNLERSGFINNKVHRENGRLSYTLAFLCASWSPGLPFVAPWWIAPKCPVCSAHFQDLGDGQFCIECGLSLKFEIPDSFAELAEKARSYQEYMKAAGGQIYMFTEPVFCSEHKELLMQKRASEYIDYRIITLLRNVGGSIQQRDIPPEYEKLFIDNNIEGMRPAIITPEKVRASIERLNKKGKVRVFDISTPRGKRIIVELIYPQISHRTTIDRTKVKMFDSYGRRM